MKVKCSSRIGMAIGTVAFAIMTGQIAAQSPSQGAQSPASPSAPRPAPPAAQTPASPSPQVNSASGDQQVTVSGCIQREADYRRSAGAGRGGAVGTGAGVGNEFILANAMMSPASTSPSPAGAGAATGTAGSSSNTAFELTGPNEGQAATHVGKRVEIIGKMKASATPGGPTANVPGSQDLKLREIEVVSIKEAAGACTPSS